MKLFHDLTCHPHGFASFLVTAAIVAALASTTLGSPTSTTAATTEAYIDSERGENGERPIVKLWDSESSADDCTDTIAARVRAATSQMETDADAARAGERTRAEMDASQQRYLLALDKAANVPVCRAGTMGELTHGTRLERLPEDAPECGSKMVKVKVLQGRERGKVGCVLRDQVVPERLP
ncbi:MAG: hypothetical protein QOD06_1381 [Candidatus Binatota bacterium]|jgi:hypothetical protein|nr:hypothetical protein [Candidatus Binatota bacterium]